MKNTSRNRARKFWFCNRWIDIPPPPKSIYWGLLLLACVAFYWLNLRTPFSHDDYAYCFFYAKDSYTVRPTSIRVNNFWQMVQSMWHHYLCVNGRFSSHLLLQTFCAFLGKETFNILNSVVFGVYLHTVTTMSGAKFNPAILLLTYFATLCLLPFPGQTMLWMTGCLNYFWPAAFSLVYINWLELKGRNSCSPLIYLVSFVLCLALGWMNESISVPVSLGLTLYFAFNYDEFRHGSISSYLGYILGTALIVLSPGTISRMTMEEGLLVQQNIVQTLFIHLYNTIWGCIHNILPLIAAIALAILILRQKIRFFFLRKSLLICIFAGFFMFLFALGWDVNRVFFGLSTFSLVFLLQLLFPFIRRETTSFAFLCFLFLVCLTPTILALRVTKDYSVYDNMVYDEVRNAPIYCIVKEHPFSINSRFVYSTTLKPDRYNFHNRVKAFYYGKLSIQALPEVLYNALCVGHLEDLLQPTTREIDGVYLFEFDSFWFLPVQQIPPRRLCATYHFQTVTSNLKPRKRIIRYLLNTQNYDAQTEVSCFGIESGQQAYLVLPKVVNRDKDVLDIQIVDYQK